jgi:hypothetical protein
VYAVSFVYMHAGTPFLKKGDAKMTLPKMDVPIDVVEWELFVPEQFKVDRFDGNLIDAGLVSSFAVTGAAASPVVMTPQSGQIAGVVVDPTGAVLPGVRVTVVSRGYRQVVTTDDNGTYIASNVPSGKVTLTAELQGFMNAQKTMQFDQTGRRVDTTMTLSGVSEMVTVEAETPVVNTAASLSSAEAQKQKKDENEAPSLNVQNLQRRVSGVLPVRIDVPRAGTSHQFVKPLVIDEEAQVTFRYRRR